MVTTNWKRWLVPAAILALPVLAFSDIAPNDDTYYDDPDLYQQYNNTPGDVSLAGSEEVILGENLALQPEHFETELGLDGWRIPVPGGLPLTTPAVGDGLVYVGGGFGSYEFYAFRALGGDPAWMFKAGDDGPTAAVYSQGRVAFNTESCILYVLDSRTGAKVWGEYLGDPLMAQPTISGGRIYMTYPGQDGQHHLTCRRLETGENLWDVPLIGEVITAPILAGGSVYAACLEGTVYRIDAQRGEILWQEQLNATSAPWIYDDQVYVSQREEGDTSDEYGTVQYEGLARLANTSGAQENAGEIWQRRQADYLRQTYNADQPYAADQAASDSSVGFSDAPATAKLGQAEANIGLGSVSGVWAYQGSRPLVIDGRSYSTAHDVLVCTDIDTGEVIYEQSYRPSGEALGGRMLTPPSYAADRLYVGTEDGYVVCYDLADGDEAWRVKIGEPIRFQPAVAHGWVYVGTERGTLVAFNTGDADADGWNMWGGDSTHNPDLD